MHKEIATFANGCFWCTEAVFQRLKGVLEVRSGFSGGNIKNPAYREVVTGRTGHAEVLHIHTTKIILKLTKRSLIVNMLSNPNFKNSSKLFLRI
jgi:peptide-methionine (S)-S-oxide reductase